MKTINRIDPPMSLVAAVAATLLLVALPVQAGPSSARSMAMGEAFTSLAMGVDAARFNPANLGLDGFRQTELELASVGVNLTNNPFSLDD